MEEDLEKYILEGMAKAQRKMGWLPNFMVKTEPPDKTRLIFKEPLNKPSKTYTDGNIVAAAS